MEPAVPADPASVEASRLAVLDSFDILDTPTEREFDALTMLAAQVCDAPYALVSLVAADRQWHMSTFGVNVAEVPRKLSFCAYALRATEVMIVGDAAADPRFADNEMVTGPPGIRFYAGAPLITDEGQVLGTLCVLDVVPRELTGKQLEQLTALSRQVMAQLLLRRQASALEHEIATRRRAEAELEQSHRLLDGVLFASTSLVYVKDLNGRFLLANPAVHEALGVPDGSVLGRTDRDLLPADLAEKFRHDDRDIAERGQPQDSTDEVIDSDGTVRYLRSRKYPLFDEAGAAYAIAGVSIDVTELISIRREVAEAAERWRDMVERSQTGVVIVSADGVLLYANPVAEQMHLGAAPGPLMGHRVHEFIEQDEQLAHSRGLLLDVLAGGSLTERPGRLRRLDGTVVSVELNATQSRYAGHECIQVEIWDTTVREAASNALRESETR